MISKYDQEFAVSVFVVSRVGESEHAASAVVFISFKRLQRDRTQRRDRDACGP